MKVAIYARYSSENQREASIEDQFRICREFARKQGWIIAGEYSDHAISGATLMRPGFQAMMAEALRGKVDVVLAEALDRFSRDQEDTAGLFKRLTFAGVGIVTLAEGDITFLHIGLKGTMNAMFLKELADKTRRGLRGRVELGKAGGGLCFGYRIVRTFKDGVVSTGEREVVPEEADIIRRIFKDYIAGISPKQIAKDLNREGLRGPRGALWGPSTIYGNPKRGTGILHNELYIGRLVWNKLRYLKDPDSGKRVSRPNPESEWVISQVPALRIVDDEQWQAVQARYAAVQKKWRSAESGKRFRQFVRPKYLFTGMTKCGVCGAGFVVYYRDRLGCFGTRERGTCTNTLTIPRQEVEARVLAALQEKLLRQDFFEEFCREFAKEMNRLRMEQRASLSGAKRELERVKREIEKVVDAIVEGYRTPELKARNDSLQERKNTLLAQLAVADEPPPLLHPSMADLYRSKVEELAAALQREDTRLEASESLRGLVESIVVTPRDGQLGIELKGNLAAMLTAAQNAKRSPETGDLCVPMKVVAGAGFEPATFGL
ncbi:recombinase family protein [Luteitalea sp.]|uniref:recombinase family protein n=1 Tax=Luteitalea sp. TaxID=2004800 RepID=UPI0025C2449D|nr:recombinase family protein [Luteitalea sp.]